MVGSNVTIPMGEGPNLYLISIKIFSAVPCMSSSALNCHFIGIALLGFNPLVVIDHNVTQHHLLFNVFCFFIFLRCFQVLLDELKFYFYILRHIGNLISISNGFKVGAWF